MKIFVTLLPLLSALIAGGAHEALPCEEKAVQEISGRTQIVCEVECDAPNTTLREKPTRHAPDRPYAVRSRERRK